MTTFRLIIELSAADTETINDNDQKVALVKEGSGQAPSDVIWVSFSPFERNVVQWQDVYGIFCSPEVPKPGTSIQPSSIQLPARPGTRYPFENGVFGTPAGDEPADLYSVANLASRTLTFGLAQSVEGGGKQIEGSPVNAVALAPQMVAAFEPSETVFVFLIKTAESGMVSSVSESEALKVPFSPSNRKQTIHYDGKMGRFVPGPLD